MALLMVQPWSIVNFITLELVFITTIGSSIATIYSTPHAKSATSRFQPSQWAVAHATFYSDGSASSSMGGACGYGNLFTNGYSTDTVSVSPSLFNNGFGCGTCYQIKCIESPWCFRGSPFVTVTATDQGPASWSQDGKWHNPSRTHFDMVPHAFQKIALLQGGIVPVMYRRVPCMRKGGLRFSFQGNGYWLLVFVMNVGGGGDISGLCVKGSKTGWISMGHNWGASFSAFANLKGQSLSFKITSYNRKQTLVAYNVAPSNWNVGLAYQAKVNFM